MSRERKKRNLPRRDVCWLIAVRAEKLSPEEAITAWFYLAGELRGMGDLDMPKYIDIIRAIRKATIYARRLDNVWTEYLNARRAI